MIAQRWIMEAIIIAGFGVAFGVASWLSDEDDENE
jgi:hypothetical protein